MRALLIVILVFLVWGTAWARHADYPLELGGFAGASLYQADGSLVTPQGSIAFGARAGYGITPLFTLEGELSIVPTQAASMGVLALGLDAHGVLNLPIRPLTRKGFVPFLSAGGGLVETSFASPSSGMAQIDVPLMRSDLAPIVDGGVGMKFYPIPGLGLRLDVRGAWGPERKDGFAAPRFAVLFGGYVRFGSAAERRVPVTDPQAGDPDEDYIYGEADKCPNQPEDRDGFEDADGCPDSDNDQDGIPDFADECPDVPENVNGIDDDDGCPDADPDGDGVLGSADQCPANAETPNGFDDADGCPDEIPDDLQKAMGVLPFVQFAAGSDEVSRANARKELDQLASVLKKYPTGVRFVIGAHTGAKGDHDALVELSQKRADAVKNYLVADGVAADALDATGHGPDVPKNGKPVERVEIGIVPPAPPASQPASAPTSQPAQ